MALVATPLTLLQQHTQNTEQQAETLGDCSQRNSVPVPGLWVTCPRGSLSAGIGYASQVIVILLNFYYIIVLAWALFYLFSSFTIDLPWGSCDHEWNTGGCGASPCPPVDPKPQESVLLLCGWDTGFGMLGHCCWRFGGRGLVHLGLCQRSPVLCSADLSGDSCSGLQLTWVPSFLASFSLVLCVSHRPSADQDHTQRKEKLNAVLLSVLDFLPAFP